MLELALLGLLKEQPLHGYELRKQLVARLGLFWTVSFGSLYPTLRRLERRGDVRRSRPADGRRRQVYTLTATGAASFLTLLEGGTSSAWEEDKFPLRLAFFRHLGPDGRLSLLERRRAYLADRLSQAEEAAGRTDGDRWLRSLLAHGAETTRRDLAWIEGLIASEDQPEDTPATPATPPPAAIQPDAPDHRPNGH